MSNHPNKSALNSFSTVLPHIADARQSLSIDNIEIRDHHATFDVSFQITIPRNLYDRITEIGEHPRSPRSTMRRYVKLALAKLQSVESGEQTNQVADDDMAGLRRVLGTTNKSSGFVVLEN